MYAMTRARWVWGLDQDPDTFLIVNGFTGILSTTCCENEPLEEGPMDLRQWNWIEEE